MELQHETELIAISVDGKEMQQAMIDRINDGPDGPTPPFRMLHDFENKVINRYGVLNAEGYRGRPVPHPAIFVIDREGVVRWKVIETDYRLRPTNEVIIEALMHARGEGEAPPVPVLTPVRARNENN